MSNSFFDSPVFLAVVIAAAILFYMVRRGAAPAGSTAKILKGKRTMSIRQIDETYAVAPQIDIDHLTELANMGFKAVISNRPDGESPDQPSAADMKKAAKAAGLEFRHIPVIPGQISALQTAEFRKAMKELPKPVLGFCRSGARASSIFEMAKNGI